MVSGMKNHSSPPRSWPMKVCPSINGSTAPKAQYLSQVQVVAPCCKTGVTATGWHTGNRFSHHFNIAQTVPVVSAKCSRKSGNHHCKREWRNTHTWRVARAGTIETYGPLARTLMYMIKQTRAATHRPGLPASTPDKPSDLHEAHPKHRSLYLISIMATAKLKSQRPIHPPVPEY